MTDARHDTPADQRQTSQRISVVVSVLILLGLALFLLWPWPRVTIGVEAQQSLTIAGPRLSAVPYTYGDALAVRIVAAVPTAAGYRYDVRYMAYGPGEHDLRDYLIGPDQRPPANVPPLVVSVAALLPNNYSGKLFDTQPTAIDLHTRYNWYMALAWMAWGVLLVPLWLYGHKPRPQVARPPPAPTLAERLRALLEHATQTRLTVEEQADLEKLLLAYWTAQLQLPPERLSETLERLRQHPAAGRQVSQLETTFHSRAAVTNGALARTLLDELGWSAKPVHSRGRR